MAEEHQHEGGRPPAAPRRRHPAHQVPPAVGGARLRLGGLLRGLRMGAGDGIPSALGESFLY